jgi:adenylate cyclase
VTNWHQLSLPAKLREAVKIEDKQRLPERIEAAIHRREIGSEILVKLFQLLVCVIWAVLFFLSPKTTAAAQSSLVPYALASYFLINLAGLAVALRRGLPDWAVYLSIALDVALLMLLIWSFHHQYMQPASFYLKAPALLYVFIFIALRALRFEARFVIAAGGLAALGWSALVAYAVFANPGDTMITRDYIQYMTSNAVLIGAEFDKIVSILLVSGIIALALRRARGFLVDATAEGITARDLSRFFDGGVVGLIRQSETALGAGEGVRREAAVLFIDIRGFTPLAAKLKPQEVVAMLTAYQEWIVPVIRRHGGTIDKFLGDGIMATFGAIEDRATAAADALRALREIMEMTAGPALHRLPQGAINGAVAAGPVISGTIGSGDRLEYTVIGAPVNLAAKLEKSNRTHRSRAITDIETFALACAQGFEPPGRPRHIRNPLPDVAEAVVLCERARE